MFLTLFLFLWAIIDILKHKPQNGIIWVVFCFILPVIGPIIYFQWKFWGRRRNPYSTEMKLFEKRKIILLFLLVGIGTIKAQVNSEWYYEFSQAVGGPLYYVGYEHYAVVGDTIIQGHSCMIVESIGGSSTDCENMGKQSHFLYRDNDQLLWYNEEQNEFTILHNYAAHKDEGWTISVNTCSFDVVVDSTSTQIVGNEERRVLYIQDENHYYDGCIIEGIGHLTRLFPQDIYWECEGSVCDGIIFTKLRCYADENVAYHFNDEPCDTTYYGHWDAIEEQNDAIVVYPTIVNDYLTILNNDYSVSNPQYQLIDGYGRVCKKGKINDSEASISLIEMPAGVYCLRIFDATKTKQIIKLIKK